MSLYLHCEVCDAADPHWTIMRTGDVVTSWACDAHLAVVCARLQRSRKAREWAAIGRSLDKIAGAP